MLRLTHTLALSSMILAIGLSWQPARGQTSSPAATAGDMIPAEKQTRLGLYLTAREAFKMWKSDPANVKILDVRTPEEYAFVGHAAMAWNIPLVFMSYEWDAERKSTVMRSNPDFLNRVKETMRPEETILVTCRSGTRSKKAVDLLTEAGYKRVYNVVDGMEGDVVRDPKSPDFGKRTINGWKNADLPWTYDLDPSLAYLSPKR
jgi:rhodanese-related sulfurtransferase